MKIIAAHLLNNFTGSPLVLAQSLRALRDAGHEVHVYTSEGPGFLDDLNGITAHTHSYRWSANRYIRLIRFAWAQLRLIFRLFRYRKEEVLIYANTLLPFGAGLAAWWMKKPTLYHIHETVVPPRSLTQFLLWVAKQAGHQLVYPSHYLKDFHSLVHPQQAVVYNALPDTFWEEVRQHQNQEREFGPLRILMICSLKRAKGVFEFIELARRLPELRFELVISQPMEAIQQFLGQEEFPENLRLFPVQKNVHPFYTRADVLLSLSHPIDWPETFGMTILEGFAYGLPAIVPPIGAPLELVEEGEQGYLLDQRDLDSIVDRLSWLAEHPEEWRRLSQNAQKKAEEFSEAQYGRQVVEMVESTEADPVASALPVVHS
ncbi:MAG: glycosyltransferase family 4 protein [Bacteroidota bacterium]